MFTIKHTELLKNLRKHFKVLNMYLYLSILKEYTLDWAFFLNGL